MVPSSHVLSVPDLKNLYHAPLMLVQQRLPSLILSCLRFNVMPPEDMPQWRDLANTVDSVSKRVNIAIVGKVPINSIIDSDYHSWCLQYNGLSDSYLSVLKALSHSAIDAKLKLEVHWIDSSELEPKTEHDHPDAYQVRSLATHDQAALIENSFRPHGIVFAVLMES